MVVVIDSLWLDSLSPVLSLYIPILLLLVVLDLSLYPGFTVGLDSFGSYYKDAILFQVFALFFLQHLVTEEVVYILLYNFS